jgi:hypothetical protein
MHTFCWNFKEWMLLANEKLPLVDIDQNVSDVYSRMNNLSRFGNEDDIHVVWDQKFLVVYHVKRENEENVQISIYDIQNDPTFLYSVTKSSDFSADKIFICKEHIVFAPLWPERAEALLTTLSINENMTIVGKFMFQNQEKRLLINEVKNFL